MFVLIAVQKYPGFGGSPIPKEIYFGGSSDCREELEKLIPDFKKKLHNQDPRWTSFHWRYVIRIWEVDQPLEL